jgi:cell division transport system permease protein
MRATFILSEIGIGLRRNLTMTIAVIITTAVSLMFFGVGLLFNRQVDTMKTFWYDKIEVSVYLCGADSQTPSCAGGAVTEEQRQQILADLRNTPQVERVYYESKQEAYKHFKHDFKNTAIAQYAKPNQLPESFRVKLKDPQQFQVISTAFSGRAGVDEVQDSRDVLKNLFKALNVARLIAWVSAAFMIAVAVLLIANTIRVSAFSRRRETGIMKLVGASSFSIQLPFLLEGAISGLVGAALACGALAVNQEFLVERLLRPNLPATNFITWSDWLMTVPILVLTGVALAALASFVTLRKYLRV